MKKTNHFPTQQKLLCALFVALITVGSYIRIPVFSVPFTMQFFTVLLAAGTLNPISTATCLICYITLGLLGLPVFAGGGGVSYLLQPTFGYLIGFLVGGFLISALNRLCKPKTVWHFFGINLLGYLPVLVCGFSYVLLLNLFYFKKALDFWTILVGSVLVFLPTDLLYCVITAAIFKRLQPILVRLESR